MSTHMAQAASPQGPSFCSLPALSLATPLLGSVSPPKAAGHATGSGVGVTPQAPLGDPLGIGIAPQQVMGVTPQVVSSDAASQYTGATGVAHQDTSVIPQATDVPHAQQFAEQQVQVGGVAQEASPVSGGACPISFAKDGSVWGWGDPERHCLAPRTRCFWIEPIWNAHGSGGQQTGAAQEHHHAGHAGGADRVGVGQEGVVVGTWRLRKAQSRNGFTRGSPRPPDLECLLARCGVAAAHTVVVVRFRVMALLGTSHVAHLALVGVALPDWVLDTDRLVAGTSADGDPGPSHM